MLFSLDLPIYQSVKDMEDVNPKKRSYVLTIIMDLVCFHRQTFGKTLPYDTYRYLGEFIIPNYQLIPLKGSNISRVLNLSNNFPEFSPWTYKHYTKKYQHYTLNQHHDFNKNYEITLGQAFMYTRFSLLKIDFLKVKLDRYYLPIFTFENNDTNQLFIKLKELSLIKDFELFKKRIHDFVPLKLILRKIKKILKNDFDFRLITYSSSKREIYNRCIQFFISDIQYFYKIIFDSKYDFFKLRHIHYLLPKLMKSFKDIRKMLKNRCRKDIQISLVSITSKT